MAIIVVVVICFHFIIFVLLGTASPKLKETAQSCDLLSFHYLCAIRNSGLRTGSATGGV